MKRVVHVCVCVCVFVQFTTTTQAAVNELLLRGKGGG